MSNRLNQLPMSLEQIRIETPCLVDWDEMRGDDKVRFCQICNKNVYNIASMTRDEATKLIQSKDPVCGRLFRRFDGTVVTADCPDAQKTSSQSIALQFSLASLFLLMTVTAVLSTVIPWAEPHLRRWANLCFVQQTPSPASNIVSPSNNIDEGAMGMILDP